MLLPSTSPQNTRSPLPPSKAIKQSNIFVLHPSISNSNFALHLSTTRISTLESSTHLSQHHHDLNFPIVDISSKSKDKVTKKNRLTSHNNIFALYTDGSGIHRTYPTSFSRDWSHEGVSSGERLHASKGKEEWNIWREVERS